MWADVGDLHRFYRTRLGQMTRRVMRRNVRALWPDVRGMCVLGVGYATPFLRPLRDEAARTIAIMPARQGVVRWPPESDNLAALSEETDLPLPDRSVDRLLLVHAVECSEQLRPMLREMWRVLADDGRLIAVVPNRRGIWARLDRTPFGHGHPYTPDQITRLLRETMFTPMRTEYGLYMPPSRRRLPVSWAQTIESIGYRWFPGFGGVLMVEAGKQIYAATTAEPARRRRVYAPAPGGANGTPRDAAARGDEPAPHLSRRRPA